MLNTGNILSFLSHYHPRGGESNGKMSDEEEERVMGRGQMKRREREKWIEVRVVG